MAPFASTDTLRASPLKTSVRVLTIQISGSLANVVVHSIAIIRMNNLFIKTMANSGAIRGDFCKFPDEFLLLIVNHEIVRNDTS